MLRSSSSPIKSLNLAARTIAGRRFKSDSTMPKSIGFIGLGQMGYPMATNLFTKTRSSTPNFYVFDAFPASAKRFVEANPQAKHATSLSQMAAETDVIVTMLPGPAQVKEVYLGKGGLLEGAKKGQLFVDSSTIDAGTVIDVSKVFSEKTGAYVIDAPVSGGTGGATKGTLSFMVGSHNPDIFKQADVLLQLMGGKIWDCGTVGAGQIAKICNNMLLGISMIAASESLNLGVKLGLDPSRLTQIINSSSGRCWSTDTYNPVPGVNPDVPSSKGYEGGFGVKLMAKDLGLAVDAAKGAGATVMLGAQAHETFKMLGGLKEFQGKDFSSVYKWLGRE